MLLCYIKEKMAKKILKILVIILVLVILATAGGTLYWLNTKIAKIVQSAIQSSKNAETIIP